MADNIAISEAKVKIRNVTYKLQGNDEALDISKELKIPIELIANNLNCACIDRELRPIGLRQSPKPYFLPVDLTVTHRSNKYQMPYLWVHNPSARHPTQVNVRTVQILLQLHSNILHAWRNDQHDIEDKKGTVITMVNNVMDKLKVDRKITRADDWLFIYLQLEESICYIYTMDPEREYPTGAEFNKYYYVKIGGKAIENTNLHISVCEVEEDTENAATEVQEEVQHAVATSTPKAKEVIKEQLPIQLPSLKEAGLLGIPLPEGTGPEAEAGPSGITAVQPRIQTIAAALPPRAESEASVQSEVGSDIDAEAIIRSLRLTSLGIEPSEEYLNILKPNFDWLKEEDRSAYTYSTRDTQGHTNNPSVAQSRYHPVIRKRYGKNCIETGSTQEWIYVTPNTEIQSTAIVGLTRLIKDDTHLITWNNQNVTIQGRLHNCTPVRAEQAQADYLGSFNRFVPYNRAISQTKIDWIASEVTGQHGPDDMATFLTSTGAINVKTATGVMQSHISMRRTVADGLALNAAAMYNTHDTSGIFLILWMMALTTEDCERQELAIQYLPSDPNSVNYYNVYCIEAETPNVVAGMNNAAARRDIILDGRKFGPVYQMMLRRLAAGLQSFTVQEGQAEKHICMSFNTPKLRFGIYSDKAENNIADRIIFSTEWLALITLLSEEWCAEADCVRGYIQASLLINGVVKRLYTDTAKKNSVNRFVTSTLEMGLFYHPRPLNRLFIYDWLNIPKKNAVDLRFQGEYLAIRASSIELLNLTSAGIAALVSMGISVQLNIANVSGWDLNRNCLAAGARTQIHEWWKEFARSHRDQFAAPILHCALSFGSIYSNFVINPTSITQRDWNTDLEWARTTGANMNDLWAGVWNKRIPYLIPALSTVDMIQLWPNVWGISQGFTKLDLSAECSRIGIPESQGWFANKGCNDYENLFKSGRPYETVFYGLCVVSAIAVEFDFEPRITWEMMSATGIYPQFQGRNSIINQPMYDDTFGFVTPGTWVTYDWDTDITLWPSIQYADFQNNAFNRISQSIVNSERAGFSSYCSIRELWTERYGMMKMSVRWNKNDQASEQMNKPSQHINTKTTLTNKTEVVCQRDLTSVEKDAEKVETPAIKRMKTVKDTEKTPIITQTEFKSGQTKLPDVEKKDDKKEEKKEDKKEEKKDEATKPLN